MVKLYMLLVTTYIILSKCNRLVSYIYNSDLPLFCILSVIVDNRIDTGIDYKKEESQAENTSVCNIAVCKDNK